MLGHSFFAKMALYAVLILAVAFTGLFFVFNHYSVARDVTFVMENGQPKPIVRCRVFSFFGSTVREATVRPDGSKTCE